tara:strand:+ start:7868 stop:8128 length:261 start_codon:yes stop_codon:yes gene_type:complete
MSITKLSTDYTKKTVTLDSYTLKFKYNTSKDYFYYDLFDINLKIIKYHQKVITGQVFSEFFFTSSDNASYATYTNIESFKLITADV